MLADRADLRSLGSYYDMSAVTALPDGNAALLKHLHGLHVAQKLAVALLGASVGDAVRYLLLVLFAWLVWPLTFRYFARLGKKNA